MAYWPIAHRNDLFVSVVLWVLLCTTFKLSMFQETSANSQQLLLIKNNTGKYSFIFPSHLLSSPFFFSLPPNSRNSYDCIGGHIAGSSPPIPTTVRALHFYREKILALSSLVDSRRINSKSHHRDSNSHRPINSSSIRGLPLDHRDWNTPNEILFAR